MISCEAAGYLGSHVGADTILCLLQGILSALKQALQPGRAVILCRLKAVIIPAAP